MKIGLVGFPGCGKTTVFNALTGLDADTGYGAAKPGTKNLGVVRVPDDRVDQLATLFSPKKKAGSPRRSNEWLVFPRSSPRR